MQRKILYGLIILAALIFSPKSIAADNHSAKRTAHDICDLFMDSKPIFAYDNLFGSQINALSFFVNDSKQPCVNYQYTYNSRGQLEKKKINHLFSGLVVTRIYSYYDSGLMKSVKESRYDLQKKLTFLYDENGNLSCIDEEILSNSSEPVFNKFDKIKYKINSKGNITEVRGIKSKYLGLSHDNSLLILYDYDKYNRLKSIRNFMNPQLSRIFNNDDYVRNE